ncbi:hypothetical protein AeMF1_007479, partial [Aphanomyces euteiches]
MPSTSRTSFKTKTVPRLVLMRIVPIFVARVLAPVATTTMRSQSVKSVSSDASPVMCVDAPLSTMMGLNAATDCRAVSSLSSILAVNVQTHSSRLCLSRSTSSFLTAFGLPVPIFAAPVAFALLAAFIPTMALFRAKRSFIVIAAVWWTQGAGLDGGLILGFQEGADACKVAAQ